jgi:hypothetical protein
MIFVLGIAFGVTDICTIFQHLFPSSNGDFIGHVHPKWDFVRNVRGGQFRGVAGVEPWWSLKGLACFVNALIWHD